MKKFLSALLAAVLLLSATACAAHEPVLPPSRWGEGEAQGMLPHTYSLSGPMTPQRWWPLLRWGIGWRRS